MITLPTTMDRRAHWGGPQGLIGLVGLAVVLLLVSSLLGGGSSPALTGGNLQGYYVQTYGSDPAAIARILTSSDCARLQARFDDAKDLFATLNRDSDAGLAQTGIMAAAADRMDTIGCETPR